jgi:RNA methyltransferase, TrmH family
LAAARKGANVGGVPRTRVLTAGPVFDHSALTYRSTASTSRHDDASEQAKRHPRSEVARRALNRLDLDTVRALRTRECRDKTGLYTIEGVRFLVSAIDASAEIAGLVVCRRLMKSAVGQMIVRRLRRAGIPELRVGETEFASVSRLADGHGRGVIGVVRQRWQTLHRLEPRDLWLAVDAVRSPGNLGTLLRTCLASGARGVVVTGSADVFDPACVRATMGALEALRIVRMTTAALGVLVRRSGGRMVAASPTASRDFRAGSYRGATVLHVGSERHGLTGEMERQCDALVRIPMTGSIDSLNVAVAGSLLLYEAYRQRFPVGRARCGG